MKAIVRSILSGLCLLTSLPVQVSADARVERSPQNQVVLLELYTSEGCSSCPPADHFLSGLKQAGISPNQLIPLAFHVSYWDYIGWKDRFASKAFDERQRRQARRNTQRTVYTPQFMLSGDDYRRYASFDKDVADVNSRPAPVDLELRSTRKENDLRLVLVTRSHDRQQTDIGVYFAVVENNLSSQVDDGENQGKTLRHDYVVRELQGPYIQSGNDEPARVTLTIQAEWKLEDLQIVAFAEDQSTGDILQAVRLKP